MRKSQLIIGALLASSIVAEAALKQAPITPELEASVKERIANRMLDPAATQIRNLRFYKSENDPGYVVCAEVNAKNKFGGYVGFEPVAAFDSGEVFIGAAASACSRL